MTGCLSMSARRYRILATVQQCPKNSITNTPKQLCYRELRTCFVPNFNVLPVITNYPFAWQSGANLRTAISSASQNNAVIYGWCNRFGTKGKSDENDDDLLGEKKMTRFQKFKFLVKNYWHVAIPVHIITSCVWLGSFYYLSLSGIDIVKLMESMGTPDRWVEAMRNSKATHFVTMYTLYKIVTPLRYAVTIGGSTLSINFLRKKGWIKPALKKDQLRRMYQEKKGAFNDFKASCQDKMQSKKGDFLKTKDEIKLHYAEARDELQKSVIDTKRELKKGAKDVSSEWKHVGGLLYKSVKEFSQGKPKADYVAKIVKETRKK